MRFTLLLAFAGLAAACGNSAAPVGDHDAGPADGGAADFAALDAAADFATGDTAAPADLGAPTEVLGTVLGESFGAATALTTTAPGATGGMTTLVDITDAAGVCALAMSNGALPDGHVIAMSLYGPTIGPLTAPATLQVSSSFTPTANSAFVNWSKAANQCTVEQVTGMSGTVTVTSVSASGVDGTFDITFQGGAHLTGRFVASPCSALATWTPPRPPGC
jgi:hypothetical protein